MFNLNERLLEAMRNIIGDFVPLLEGANPDLLLFAGCTGSCKGNCKLQCKGCKNTCKGKCKGTRKGK